MNARLLARLFDSSSRLYALRGAQGLDELAVQCWSLRERLSEPWQMELVVLGSAIGADLRAWLGQRATLLTRLADGSLQGRSGVVLQAHGLGGDGGLARYRLEVCAWPALLAGQQRSQVWQDRSVVQIVDDVLGAHARHAEWRWAEDVAAHLAVSPFSDASGRRSYCVQYRESDLDFLQRLLAEEGLGWRMEEIEPPAEHDAPALTTQRMVLFADSTLAQSCPEDLTSHGGGGIRYHRSAAVERSDALQAFAGLRQLHSAATASLSWDYKAHRAVAAEAFSPWRLGGAHAPSLQAYEPAGAYAHADSVRAVRATELLQQTLQARHKRFAGRSSVRSFSAGRCFKLREFPLAAAASTDQRSEDTLRFLLTEVIHAGINNLPREQSGQLAGLPSHESSDAQRGGQLAEWVGPDVRRQAAAAGYGNSFTAQRASVPWRAWRRDHHGARLNPRPTAPSLQTATVVGPQGEVSDHDPEIHTDALGRVRIRYPWQGFGPSGQETCRSSSWVRVAQRWAGPGCGAQFIPRIGQEVLVTYLDGDIDRPVVTGVLYNGRGEAGVALTPGGRPASEDRHALSASTDHCPSGQVNLEGGHAPAWHGAAPEPALPRACGQANAAALSGWKTQEFAGSGYNQLVFDDSDAQLRVQLASTQHASQLNLGHLVHQADNHRGSFRGLGLELRTDAFGAVRADRGVLLTTYATEAAAPAGDNVAGVALGGQLHTLAHTLSQAARTHETTPLAADLGGSKPGASAMNDREPLLRALHTALRGMVDADGMPDALADAHARRTKPGPDKLPHCSDAVVALSAKAGLAAAAGQDLQVAAAETVVLAAGQDLHWATGSALRIHTGQSIGVLAGAVQPGGDSVGTGVNLTTGRGDIEFQAQAGALQIAAKDDVTVQSASSHVDWAAAKRITLATAGGANIVLEAGDITVMCPGKITVRASKKSFQLGEFVNVDLPTFPSHAGPLSEAFAFKDETGRAIAELPFVLDKATLRAQRDSMIDGGTQRVYSADAEPVKTTLRISAIDIDRDTF